MFFPVRSIKTLSGGTKSVIANLWLFHYSDSLPRTVARAFGSFGASAGVIPQWLYGAKVPKSANVKADFVKIAWKKNDRALRPTG